MASNLFITDHVRRTRKGNFSDVSVLLFREEGGGQDTSCPGPALGGGGGRVHPVLVLRRGRVCPGPAEGGEGAP